MKKVLTACVEGWELAPGGWRSYGSTTTPLARWYRDMTRDGKAHFTPGLHLPHLLMVKIEYLWKLGLLPMPLDVVCAMALEDLVNQHLDPKLKIRDFVWDRHNKCHKLRDE